MNIKLNKKYLLSFILTFAVGITVSAFGQEEELKKQEQQAASIEKMQQRIAEIEKEMKEGEFKRTQALGEEAFGLIGQIDETYLQMKESYQQQVIQLNSRMRQVWEKIENSEGATRESLDNKLQLLQSDWDRVYQRLTRTHDQHLDQLKDGIRKLRNEFSTAAGRAEEELETSHFESMARWEQTHEVFLNVNQTYAQIVGDTLVHLKKRLREEPGNRELADRLEKVKDRYFTVQRRLQTRYRSHLGHLDDELAIRMIQLEATEEGKSKLQIEQLLEQLRDRKNETFKNLQVSYRETISASESVLSEMNSRLNTTTGRAKENLEDQLAELQSEIAESKSSLQKSYSGQISFIEKQIEHLTNRLSGADEETKQLISTRMNDLRSNVETLTKNSDALKAKADEKVRR